MRLEKRGKIKKSPPFSDGDKIFDEFLYITTNFLILGYSPTVCCIFLTSTFLGEIFSAEEIAAAAPAASPNAIQTDIIRKFE